MSDDGKPDLPKREHISPDSARTETKRISVNASERPNPRFEAAQRRAQRRLETASRSQVAADSDADEAGSSGNGTSQAAAGGSGFSFNMTNKPAAADPPSGGSGATPDDTLGLDELTEMAGELGVPADDPVATADASDDPTDVTLDT
jgi:hypothetical protein